MDYMKLVVFVILVLINFSCDNNVKPVESNNNTLNSLIKVPLARQATSYTCGVASLQSLLYYFGDDWRQDNLATELGSDSANGTNYNNIVKFCKKLNYSVNVYKELSIDSLKSMVSKGNPILVVIQAWAGTSVDYKNEWESGHYVICVGYDNNNLYFMDPSTLGNYTYIPTNEFLSRWHDNDQEGNLLSHFAISITKNNIKYNPNNILRME
jgi:predicted double-glycine peptidase